MRVEFEPEELARLMVEVRRQQVAGMTLNDLTAFVQACNTDRLANGTSSKLACIRLLRNSFGLGLKEAKLWLETVVPRFRPKIEDEQGTEGNE